MSSPKSAMTAGVLGIILGVFGVHDWYLDRFKPAKLHVTLAVSGVILYAISLVTHSWISSTGDSQTLATVMNSLSTTTRVLAWLAIGVSAVWGLLEAILILVQGNAGLVAQGYTVIEHTPDPEPEVAQPMPSFIAMEGMPSGSVIFDPKPSSTSSQTLAQQSVQSVTQPMSQQSMAQMSIQTPIAQAPVQQPAPGIKPQPTSVFPAQPTVSPQPGVQANPSATASVSALAAPNVTLPPSPTLAEQASNANAAPPPIIFHSGNIDQQNNAMASDQPLSTKNVNPPALTVQSRSGKNQLNPVVIRRLLIGGVVAVAFIVLSVMIRNGIVSVIAAGYGESYRAAKELSTILTKIHKSSGCKFAVDYVQSAVVDRKAYNEYVNNCTDLTKGAGELVEKLGNTPAIKWSSTINSQFTEFRQLYNETLPENFDELVANLSLYLVWHEYILRVDSLTMDSTDSAFQQAADVLRQSNNRTLSQYGEEWLLKEMEYLQIYRQYWDTSYTDESKDALRDEVEAKRVALQDWIQDHRPDVTKIAPIYVPDTNAMYASFTKLYDEIKDGYENNYDYDSRDCQKAGKKVYCD